MSLISRWRFMVAWIFAGVILWGIGGDIFALIPEFRLAVFWRSYRSLVFIGYVIVSVFAWGVGWLHGLGFLRLPLQTAFDKVAAIVRAVHHIPKTLRLILAAGTLLSPPILLLFTPIGFEPIGSFLRVSIVFASALIVCILTIPAAPLRKWSFALFYAFIMVAAVFYIGSNLTMVSAYPYSLGWSEGNRLWDYSIRFGSDRYIFPEGFEIFALISPGRELLMGLPYLLPKISIFSVRLWVSFVQVATPIALGLLLVVRNKPRKEVWKDAILFSAWGSLFLLQGPIQARLIVSAIIMMFGVRNKNLVVAIILVMLAGYYANISRWSWTYAPGLWAGMIALLRVNSPSLRREDWGKLKRPISLGLAGYFGGQILTVLIPMTNNTVNNSGEISLIMPAANQTAFSQAFLWYRWLPNPTFPPGILLALLFVIAPLAFWLYLARKYGGWRMNRLKILGISFPLAAFLAVGLVASTKIGGGGDLHNTDMLLVGMLILAAHAWPHMLSILREKSIPPFALVSAYIVLIMPVFYGIGGVRSLDLPPEESVSSSLIVIQEEVAIASQQGEVLFMDQRQLLTFGYFQDLPLVDDYEKKLLMDRAMAGWQEYFEEFYTDLENHRFSLIVTEPIFLSTGDTDKPFAEENDIWVTWVSRYLLKHYRVLKNFKAVGIQLLVPREP